MMSPSPRLIIDESDEPQAAAAVGGGEGRAAGLIDAGRLLL